jgi:hypothetical protein
MDDELKKLLQENLEVSHESLKILKKVNRDRIWGKVYGFLKFAFFVALTVGSVIYVEPYLRTMLDMLSKVSAGVGEVQKTGQALNPSAISPELINKLKGLLGQ